MAAQGPPQVVIWQRIEHVISGRPRTARHEHAPVLRRQGGARMRIALDDEFHTALTHKSRIDVRQVEAVGKAVDLQRDAM